MLLAEYSTESAKLANYTLSAAYDNLQGDPPQDIPLIVWLLENPDSRCSLPGAISLENHDRLHLILDRGFSGEDEAYLVGFCMGNDLRTNAIHLIMIKAIAFLFYPKIYRFTAADIKAFDLGVKLGRTTKIKNLNQEMPTDWNGKTLTEIRHELDL